MPRTSNLTHNMHQELLWVHSDIDHPHWELDMLNKSSPPTSSTATLSVNSSVAQWMSDQEVMVSYVHCGPGRWTAAIAAADYFLSPSSTTWPLHLIWVHMSAETFMQSRWWSLSHLWIIILQRQILLDYFCPPLSNWRDQTQELCNKPSGYGQHLDNKHLMNTMIRNPSITKWTFVLPARWTSKIMDSNKVYVDPNPHQNPSQGNLKCLAPQRLKCDSDQKVNQEKSCPAPFKKKVQSSDQFLPGG